MGLGEEESVLTSEVSLFQGLKSTQTESVLFREVSSFQGCPYRGVPLYISHPEIRTPH